MAETTPTLYWDELPALWKEMGTNQKEYADLIQQKYKGSKKGLSESNISRLVTGSREHKRKRMPEPLVRWTLKLPAEEGFEQTWAAHRDELLTRPVPPAVAPALAASAPVAPTPVFSPAATPAPGALVEPPQVAAPAGQVPLPQASLPVAVESPPAPVPAGPVAVPPPAALQAGAPQALSPVAVQPPPTVPAAPVAEPAPIAPGAQIASQPAPVVVLPLQAAPAGQAQPSQSTAPVAAPTTASAPVSAAGPTVSPQAASGQAPASSSPPAMPPGAQPAGPGAPRRRLRLARRARAALIGMGFATSAAVIVACASFVRSQERGLCTSAIAELAGKYARSIEALADSHKQDSATTYALAHALDLLLAQGTGARNTNSLVIEESAEDLGSRRIIPDHPLKDQKTEPCNAEAAEDAINGGCWVWTGRVAPCPSMTWEHADKCYLPVHKKPKVPSAVVPNGNPQQ